MIYLFGSAGWDTGRKIVKVGYTSNKEERERTYNLHNPGGVFLGWRPGSEILEAKLHLRLVDWKTEFLDEWFDWDPQIMKIFGEPEGKLDRWLWTERDRLFYPIPAPGTKAREIFDQLRVGAGEKLL